MLRKSKSGILRQGKSRALQTDFVGMFAISLLWRLVSVIEQVITRSLAKLDLLVHNMTVDDQLQEQLKLECSEERDEFHH